MMFSQLWVQSVFVCRVCEVPDSILGGGIGSQQMVSLEMRSAAYGVEPARMESAINGYNVNGVECPAW